MTAQIVMLIFGVIWIGGYAAVLHETSMAPDARWYQILGGWVVLFFIWPYIAACMNTDH